MAMLYLIYPVLRSSDQGCRTPSPNIITATTNSLSFNAAKTLGYVQKKTWSTNDLPKYDTREALQTTADAYLDIWTKSNTYIIVP
jgi:transposase